MKLPKLNFPECDFNIVMNEDGGQSSKIFDMVRKKFVVLTPEEWVRQHLIHFLIHEKKFPKGLMGVEKKLLVNNLLRRTDVVIYNDKLKPLLIAECKSPQVKISQNVFDQAARYNLSLDVKYFILTNGLETFCCMMDHEKQKYLFLEEVHF